MIKSKFLFQSLLVILILAFAIGPTAAVGSEVQETDYTEELNTNSTAVTNNSSNSNINTSVVTVDEPSNTGNNSSTGTTSPTASETISVDVSDKNGNQVDEVNAILVYQDQDWSETYTEIKNYPGVDIPQYINLPAGHEYYITAYVHDQSAGGTGWISLSDGESKSVDITTGDFVWVRPRVFYSDGSTPMEGATVEIESHEPTVWRSTTTKSDGYTDPEKLWLHETDDYGSYTVKIYDNNNDIIGKKELSSLDDNRDISITTSKTQQYYLDTSSTSGGAVSPSSGDYDRGETVSVTANPDSGYVFDHWSGDYPSGSKTDPDITVQMDSDKTLQANFVENEADLTVDVRDQNGNQVDETNALLLYRDGNWDEPYKKVESYPGVDLQKTFSNLPAGHDYYVTAYVNDQYAGDTGSWISLNPGNSVDKTIQVDTAVSIKPQVFYSDGTTPLEGATVTVESHEPTEWRSATTTSDGYTDPEKLWLHPTGDSGSYTVTVTHDGQQIASKDISSLDSSRTVSIQTSKTKRYDLTTSSTSGGTVSPSSGSYDQGKSVSVTANPDSGYVFDHWSGDYPSGSKTDPDITVQMDSDKTLQANFVENEADLTVDVRDQNGNQVDETNALLLYRDGNWDEPYNKTENYPGVNLQETFSDLPAGHDYYVTAYVNDQYAGDTGNWISLNPGDSVDKTIQVDSAVSIKPQVFYSDGTTPLEGATVTVESHEPTEWRNATTNSDGYTDPEKLWLHPTGDAGSYTVNVSKQGEQVASKNLTTLDASQELKITTDAEPQAYIEVGHTSPSTGSQVSLELRDQPDGADISWTINSEPVAGAGSLLHNEGPHTTLTTEAEGSYTVAAEIQISGETKTLQRKINAQNKEVEQVDRTANALLEQHAPILYFHPDERFFPTRYENYVEKSSLDTSTGTIDDSNLLDLAGRGESAAIDPGTTDDDKMYKLQDLDTYPETVYGSVDESVNYQGEKYTAVSYWLFYVHDPKPADISPITEMAKHTGDQEKITVLINESGPQWVATTQHYGGEIRRWEKVNKTEQRPRLLIGQGSHPVFFEPHTGELSGNILEPVSQNAEHKKLYQSQYLTGALGVEVPGLPGSTAPHPFSLINSYVDPVSKGQKMTPEDYDTILLTKDLAWSDYRGDVYTYPAIPERGTIAMQQRFWKNKSSWLSEDIGVSHEHFDAKIEDSIFDSGPSVNRRSKPVTTDLTVANTGPQSGKFVLNVTSRHESGTTHTAEYGQMINSGFIFDAPRLPPFYAKNTRQLAVPVFPESATNIDSGEWTTTIELASYTSDIRDSKDVHDTTEFTFEYDTDIDATAKFVDTPTGELTPGDVARSTVQVENTGESEREFFVGYSAVGPSGEFYDNNGTTGKPITLGPGEQDTVDVEWTIKQGIPEGEYGLLTAVWAESNRTALQTQLDSDQVANVVSVTDTNVGQLSITTEPKGATIEVGGEPLDQRSPGTVELDGGEHTVAVNTDGFKSESKTVTVTPGEENSVSYTLESSENLTVDAGGPYTVTEGNSVPLASNSYHPNGTIEDESWAVIDGPGTISDENYVAPTTIDSSTTATVELTVTGNDGTTATDTATVTVESDQPPSANFSWSPTNPKEGESISFNDTSTDPDGQIESYSWQFGDGTSSSNANPTHTYSSNGSYDVTLTVTDNDGNIDSATKTVEVLSTDDSNEPPVADAGGSYSVDEGGSVGLDASGSSDSDGSITSTNWTVIDGPGSISNNTYNAPDSILNDTQVTVEVTVTDDNGATGTDTATVSVTSDDKTPSNGSFVYRMPHALNEQKLSGGWGSKLIVRATKNETNVSIDADSDGAVEQTSTLAAEEGTSVSTPTPGAVVTASEPVEVTYRYGSVDFSAYEDGRYRYGIPESDTLGTEYYTPMTADTLAIAATADTEVQADIDADGNIERTVSLNANESVSFTDIAAGARVTADENIHVVVTNTQWSNMDDTYAASLLPISGAQSSYNLPGHPSYNVDDPTDKTRVAFVGTQNGTDVTVGDQTTTVSTGEVATVQTAENTTLKADAPVVALYAIHLNGKDWWGSDYREFIGVGTPVDSFEIKAGEWSGKHFDGGLSAWSSYNSDGMTVQNQNPIADVGGPYSVAEGKTVEVDASASSDPDGSITSTDWTVIDGPGSISSGTYNAPNSISNDTQATVEVTVTDDDGATDTATTTVTVTPNSGSTIGDYTNENGTVDTSGLGDAIDDWVANDVGTGLLQEVITAWVSS